LRPQVPDGLRRAFAAHDVRRQAVVRNKGGADHIAAHRAYPKKHDVFVLDFINDTETIRAAFDRYFRTMVLSDETDPNKLYDLVAALDAHQVYDQAQVAELMELYLGGADRERLHSILDACVAAYKEQLDEDAQVDFKGKAKAKAFTLTYSFLTAILPYTDAVFGLTYRHPPP
jgi:type I restriction enzyme, R subunit